MAKIEASGKVDGDGILRITNRRFFDHALKGFAGKDVVLTIARKRKQRTTWQNRYYWGVIVPLVWKGLVDNGYNEIQCLEDAHEVLKALFHKKTFVDKTTGDMTTYGASTTELSTIEFSEYKEKIQQWAAEALNVLIPDPIEMEVTQ